MPIYKRPEEKAGETVTVRLTIDERRMLDHLSALDEMTLTDFIRSLIAKRAAELNVTGPPPPKVRRRPGRPKMKRPAPETVEVSPAFRVEQQAQTFPVEPASVPIATDSPAPGTPLVSATPPRFETSPPALPPSRISIPAPSSYSKYPETKNPSVFGDLVIRFRNSFVHRADGTKRELEETISFLCRETDNGPVIPENFPLAALTTERLFDVRQAIRDTDIRLAKKNLYLTYLRMMLHFAVKEPDIDLRINPSRELPPFSIFESEERRRFFTGGGE